MHAFIWHHKLSLYHAELIITHYPEQWEGYGLAGKALIALGEFKSTEQWIKKGFKARNQLNLLAIVSEIYITR